MSIDDSTLTASNSYGTFSVAKNLVPLFAAYALVPYIAHRSLALAWALMPIVGLLIYRLTMVMHDCGHLTLFSSRKANVLVGKFLGSVTGVDFSSFRERHWEHHKSYGVSGDPQGFHYIGTSEMSRPAFVWHLAKPVFGLNLNYVISESILSPHNLRKSFLNGEILGIVVIQIAILALITSAGRHPSLSVLPFVAAATFGLFFSQLRGIAEHGIRATSAAPEGFVKSHRTDWLGRLFLYDMHFNFHAEHHWNPAIPSCHLPTIANAKGASGTDQPTMWCTLKRMTSTP